jgi:hypothetical protein
MNKIIISILLAAATVCAADTNTVPTAPRVKLPQGGYATVQIPEDMIAWDRDTLETNVPAATKSVSFAFKFKNISSETVTILNIRESCGCMVLTPPSSILKAGDEGQIGVTVKLIGKHLDWVNTKTIQVEMDKGTKTLTMKITT